VKKEKGKTEYSIKETSSNVTIHSRPRVMYVFSGRQGKQLPPAEQC
jgi:hypothetical protein